MTNKDERIRELEKDRIFSIITIMILVLAIIGVFFAFLYGDGERSIKNLELKLQSCQEKVPVRNSVLFYKCEDETLKNVLIDENNKSIYDYNIKEGCEVLK